MLGAQDRARREGERDLAVAHTTASLQRAKKIEPLDRYLPRRPTQHGARPRMLDRLKAIAAATADLS